MQSPNELVFDDQQPHLFKHPSQNPLQWTKCGLHADKHIGNSEGLIARILQLLKGKKPEIAYSAYSKSPSMGDLCLKLHC